MLILGIETSCDETAVSLIERGEQNRVLSEQIKSQISIHSQYGGVVPEIASRNHFEVIDCLTNHVLNEGKITIQNINLISVTQGPGLIGSLLVGLSFAKALSFSRKIPLVPVDHLFSHIESAFIENPDISYPIIALVVSGGHTSLFYQKSKFEVELLAKTRDDAIGEVMDKIAKFYNLGYPGGPVLDKIYKTGDKSRFSFTFPRMSDGSDDFSFSGYKTAVLKLTRKYHITKNSKLFEDLVASFLHSVVDYLLLKTKKAAELYQTASVIVAGGVSRNSLLREKFKNAFENKKYSLYMPAAKYCTDNATMTAWLGYETFTTFPRRNYFDYRLNAYSRAVFCGSKNKKHR